MKITDKHEKAFNKWLKENEEIDYRSSIQCDKYFILRVRENGEFALVPGDVRKGRIIFAKETPKGISYLYDSAQLYRGWDTERKDFSELSALDLNIYIHLVLSLTDDVTASAGILLGFADDIKDVICKYISLNPDAKGENALAMMQRCVGFFLNPYFCYVAFYRGYKSMNMAREAGIAHEMMGRTFDTGIIKNAK